MDTAIRTEGEAVILAALGHLTGATVSREVLELGINWAQARREAAQFLTNSSSDGKS